MPQYICTLPHGCFEYTDGHYSTVVKSVQHDDKTLSLTTACKLKLTLEASNVVEHLIHEKQQSNVAKVTKVAKDQ